MNTITIDTLETILRETLNKTECMDETSKVRLLPQECVSNAKYLFCIQGPHGGYLDLAEIEKNLVPEENNDGIKANKSNSPFINVQTYEFVPIMGDKLSLDRVELRDSDCVCLNTSQICYISSFNNNGHIYYKLALVNKETLIIDRLSFSCVKSLIEGGTHAESE